MCFKINADFSNPNSFLSGDVKVSRPEAHQAKNKAFTNLCVLNVNKWSNTVLKCLYVLHVPNEHKKLPSLFLGLSL